MRPLRARRWPGPDPARPQTESIRRGFRPATGRTRASELRSSFQVMDGISPTPRSKPPPGAPRTRRGWSTRRHLLDAAELVFGERGFHDAAISEITRTAGVGMGTFYLYFESKEAIFTELVREMGHNMRHHRRLATAPAGHRAVAEEAGYRAFFGFVAQHPHLYRIVRESQFVAPEAYREWYDRLAEGYVSGISAAMDSRAVPPPRSGRGGLLPDGDRRLPGPALRALGGPAPDPRPGSADDHGGRPQRAATAPGGARRQRLTPPPAIGYSAKELNRCSG